MFEVDCTDVRNSLRTLAELDLVRSRLGLVRSRVRDFRKVGRYFDLKKSPRGGG